MANMRNRGTGRARMRRYTRVDAGKRSAEAAESNLLPPDFNPAVPGEQPLNAASLGDSVVNLWFTVPLFDGYVEECRSVLRLERGRFRL